MNSRNGICNDIDRVSLSIDNRGSIELDLFRPAVTSGYAETRKKSSSIDYDRVTYTVHRYFAEIAKSMLKSLRVMLNHLPSHFRHS